MWKSLVKFTVWAVFFIMLVTTVVGAENTSGRLTAVNADSFWIVPEIESLLLLNCDQPLSKPTDYVIYDYAGKEILSGKAYPENKTITVKICLKQGYYDIKFSEFKQTFGIVALPEYTGIRDHFWGMHTNLAQQSLREFDADGLGRVLVRIGIGAAREGLGSLDRIVKSPSVFDFNVKDYTGIMDFYDSNDIQVMTMFEGVPVWMGAHNSTRDLPADLIAFAKSWSVFSAYMQYHTAEFEIWNEADTALFSGNKPLDIYVALLKTVNYLKVDSNKSFKIGNSGFTSPFELNSSRFMLLNQNGFFENIDFFSFHHHTNWMDGEAAIEKNLLQYGEIIENYNAALKSSGNEMLPIYNTESGFSHPGGPRPSAEWGRVCATVMAFKAIESRAYGLAKFFAFYLKPHQENIKFWGMTDSDHSPLRSLAAYAFAIKELSNSEYVGELPDLESTWNRVFKRGDIAVVVLYKPNRTQIQKISESVLSIRGTDGRILSTADELDQLIYVTVPYHLLKSVLDQKGHAYQLYQAKNRSKEKKNKPACSPVVLNRKLVSGVTYSTLENYSVLSEDLKSYPVEMEVNNLSDQSRILSLVLLCEEKILSRKTLAIKPNARGNVRFDANLSAFLTDGKYKLLKVEATGEGMLPACYSMWIRKENDLADFLKQYPERTALKIKDIANWSLKGGAAGRDKTMLKAEPGDDGIRFQVKFPESIRDRWCYPYLKFGRDLVGAKGLVIRGKVSNPCATLIVVGGFNNQFAQNKWAYLPADNKFHSVFVPLKNENLNKLTGLAIGGNSSSAENCFEYSDIYIVY